MSMVYEPEAVWIADPAEVKTKQADAESADINILIGRFGIGAVAVPQPGMEPMYGDFSRGLDFHQAVEAVRSAQRDFENLPLAVRDACGNDPGRFLDMVFDPSPEARARLLELGLLEVQRPRSIAESSVEELAAALKPAEPAPTVGVT